MTIDISVHKGLFSGKDLYTQINWQAWAIFCQMQYEQILGANIATVVCHSTKEMAEVPTYHLHIETSFPHTGFCACV